jgi:hypothetical protein
MIRPPRAPRPARRTHRRIQPRSMRTDFARPTGRLARVAVPSVTDGWQWDMNSRFCGRFSGLSARTSSPTASSFRFARHGVAPSTCGAASPESWLTALCAESGRWLLIASVRRRGDRRQHDLASPERFPECFRSPRTCSRGDAPVEHDAGDEQQSRCRSLRPRASRARPAAASWTDPRRLCPVPPRSQSHAFARRIAGRGSLNCRGCRRRGERDRVAPDTARRGGRVDEVRLGTDPGDGPLHGPHRLDRAGSTVGDRAWADLVRFTNSIRLQIGRIGWRVRVS